MTVATPNIVIKNNDRVIVARSESVVLHHDDETARCLNALEHFINPDNADSIFILTGQAGTGKTSLIDDIIRICTKVDAEVELLAPTGRAANIISQKTQRQASTIHSCIYKPVLDEDTFRVHLNLRTNSCPDYTIYIVDEASMVNNNGDTDNARLFAECGLLTDFLNYCCQGNAKNKVIFIGDPFQLPPVGDTFSPALDRNYLINTFNKKVASFELTKVKRQLDGSPILKFATQLRGNMQGLNLPALPPYYMHRNTYAMADAFKATFQNKNMRSAVMICQSNKAAYVSNSIIRKKIFGGTCSMQPRVGDLVMLNQNHYGTTYDIFNGTSGIIAEINATNMQHIGDVAFTPALVLFQKNGSVLQHRGLIMLNLLTGDKPDLTPEQEKSLMADAFRRNKKLRESHNTCDDKFLSALRLRYGYAITCHKAQGGEWNNVFINPYHNKNDNRWLYTAVTRASNQLHSCFTN